MYTTFTRLSFASFCIFASFAIVPLAIKEFFVYGTPIEDTIRKHSNIYDFCLRLKTNSLSTGKFVHYVDKEIVTDDLSRTTRYYIANGLQAGSIYKQFNDGRQSAVNKGFNGIIFNKYVEKDMKDYNINYRFYIQEAYKLKNSIDDNQLSLF